MIKVLLGGCANVVRLELEGGARIDVIEYRKNQVTVRAPESLRLTHKIKVIKDEFDDSITCEVVKNTKSKK